MSSKFKLIIVDLGNVLITFNHWIAANKFLRFSKSSLSDIYNLFFDSQLLHTFEEGHIKGEEFFLAVKQEIELQLDYDKFLPIWNEIFYLTSENIELFQLVRTLKAKYKVIVLSNINQLHFDYLKQNFRIFDPFDAVILSYEVGFRKPDPHIYKHALNLFSVHPEESFYIDDRLDLIEQAQQLSIPGVQFKSSQALKSKLEEIGILEPERKQPALRS
jgi:putative hydrolase of the HAD superfamily